MMLRRTFQTVIRVLLEHNDGHWKPESNEEIVNTSNLFTITAVVQLLGYLVDEVERLCPQEKTSKCTKEREGKYQMSHPGPTRHSTDKRMAISSPRISPQK